MSDIVVVAIIVAMSSIIVGIVPVTLNNRQRAKDRAEDRADRAEVAAAAKVVASEARETARLLRDETAKSRTRTDEVARLAEATAAGVTQQLTVLGEGVERVHKLVNSDMTAARRDELIGARATLEALQRANVVDPNPDDEAKIAAVADRIDELEAILADRLVQQRAVDRQQIADAEAQH
jgi:hypothetical protein